MDADDCKACAGCLSRRTLAVTLEGNRFAAQIHSGNSISVSGTPK
jgi:hypothetical protein